MSEPSKAYPPTCLLCQHFSYSEGFGSENSEDETWERTAFTCYKGHELEGADDLVRAAVCPDLDAISADRRDEMIRAAAAKP